MIASGLIAFLRRAALAGLVVHAVATFTHSLPTTPGHVLTATVLLACAASCLLNATLKVELRLVWAICGAGLLAWGGGEAALATTSTESTGLTGADLLSLAFYPAAALTLVLLLRRRMGGFFTTLWLDGLAGALAISALAAAFLLPPVLAGRTQGPTDLLAVLAYPAADLLLVLCALFALALTGWRPGVTLAGVGTAVLLVGLTDASSLWWSAAGHSAADMPWASLWPAAAVLLAELSGRAPDERRSPSETGLRLLLVPLAFSLTAVALLASGIVHSLDIAGYELAVGALIIIVVRLALTVLDNLHLAQDSRTEAVTDALTGLGNRRLLMADVEAALAAGTAAHTLILFDLDGFKLYNDTFGHPAGDALLSRLGHALRAAAAPFGAAYRLGGDEFCVLARDTDAPPDRAIAVSIAALSEHGSGFSVTPSQGSVAIPGETRDLTAAFQMADQRLYLQKGDRRRSRDSDQVRDVLLQAVRERQPDLDRHVGGVAALARDVARTMRLDAEGVDEVIRAAELHDIGKMAVPDAILAKPTTLDADEQALIRQHTMIGERILAVAPALRSVGGLVRSSHERWDGHGYPDGLAGEDIPVGSRIVAVCDAYEAMVGGRPYKDRISPAEALEELRRCSGGQFDPAVVEAFQRAVQTNAAPTAVAP